jgi:hypothetical protein
MADVMDDLQTFPGYQGYHTREQASGALANGTRVRKIYSDPRDRRQDGSTGAVLGSVHHGTLGYGYFVEWDDEPGRAVFVVGERCAPAGTPHEPWP